LKIGAILYGSGVLLLFRCRIGSQRIANTQLIDIMVGQSNAGACFSSVTFVGYQINGISGTHFNAGDIFTFICVCSIIEPLVKKNEKF
jgi:chromate transporter